MNKSLELFTSRVYRKSRSESSVQTYLWGLKVFRVFMGCKDEEELVAKVKAGDINVVNELNRWLDELDDKGKSPQTQHVYFNAVKKFFTVVLPDMKVNWKRVDLPRVWRVEEDRIPTREELRSIMHHGTILDCMITTTLASGGMRENTLAGLTVGAVDLEAYKDVGVVYVRPEIAKDRVKYVAFITAEAKRFLQQYLDLRRRKGETITKNSPLIVKRKRKPDGEGYTVHHVTADNLRQRWRRHLKRAGMAEKGRTFHKLRMHTLRKFFRTNLELAGISKSFRERLMGHKGEAYDDAYFKPRIEQLLNEYRKAIPNLTIMEEVDETKRLKRQAAITLRTLVEAGVFPEEEFKRLEPQLARAKNVEEVYSKLRRLRDPESTENDNGTYINGNGYRAKVIGEDELIVHVEAGWDVVKELSEGKFIVRKQAV